MVGDIRLHAEISEPPESRPAGNAIPKYVYYEVAEWRRRTAYDPFGDGRMVVEAECTRTVRLTRPLEGYAGHEDGIAQFGDEYWRIIWGVACDR